MATRARGERTRQDIINAALRLFAVHGYQPTSTCDIIEAVSISKGAFYHHFKSKQDLALTVLDQVRSQYEEMVAQPTQQQPDPGARLGQMIRTVVELNNSGRWNNCLLLSRLVQETTELEGPLKERVVATINWLVGLCAESVTQAQQAGAVNGTFDPQELSRLVISSLLGAVSVEELGEHIMTLRGVANQLLQLLGLGAIAEASSPATTDQATQPPASGETDEGFGPNEGFGTRESFS